jgi:hypothetical protein
VVPLYNQQYVCDETNLVSQIPPIFLPRCISWGARRCVGHVKLTVACWLKPLRTGNAKRDVVLEYVIAILEPCEMIAT